MALLLRSLGALVPLALLAACSAPTPRPPLPLAGEAPAPSAAAPETSLAATSEPPTEPAPSLQDEPPPSTSAAPDGTSGDGTPQRETERSLGPADVLAVVTAHRAEVVRACSASNDAATTKVLLKLTIAKTGRVSQVLTEGPAATAACVARAVRGFRFPASSSDTRVNIPIVIRK